MTVVLEDIYPAHIDDKGRIQSVEEHCRSTARYASESIRGVLLQNAAYFAGLLHDFGKYTEAYKNYIVRAANGENVHRGSVNHTFAGVKYLLEHFHKQKNGMFSETDVVCELIAYAVGAHHGLFDIVDENHKSGFLHRIKKENISYTETKENFIKRCADEEELDALFLKAVSECTELIRRFQDWTSAKDVATANDEIAFYLGLVARLLTSAVIEGDRSDTAEFMKGIRHENRLRGDEADWKDMLERAERHIIGKQSNTAVGIARTIISEQCRCFSRHPVGLYRLYVPTGGGKTLSALRFALAHALEKKKKRIFYIAPLISILEQNAQVIRDAVGRDDLVLEHHSNVIRDMDNDDELHKSELLTENWQSPIVVTTLVQLLNTLFSHRTSSIRRFQALCNSVIILDEVQTVPSNMLSLFNLAMNFLAGVCNATVLLCSATQPCLDRVNHALRVEFQTPVPYDEMLWKAFARTDILPMGGLRLEEIPGFIEESLKRFNSVLIICNKKSEAETLFKYLRSGEWRTFHLSASMCMQHRRDVLKGIDDLLIESRNDVKKMVCVATQVVEAGVDFSFQCVVRLLAGMDSVVQAAGRCNRNGEQLEGRAPVYIIDCVDERLTGLREIQEGKTATRALLDAFSKDKRRFSNDLTSNASIEFYYRELYRQMPRGHQDYPIQELDTTAFELLAQNYKWASDECEERDQFILKQAFKSAGRFFKVFDNNTVDVVVPYGEGRRLIQELMETDIRYDLAKANELLQAVKSYTVTLYDYQLKKLESLGAVVHLLDDSVLALMNSYDVETGLTLEQGTNAIWGD